MSLTVASLHVHPVKATAPVDLTASHVALEGLAHDRRWAVVTPQGRRLNATTHDRLLRVTATPVADGSIVLSAPGRPDLPVPVPVDGPAVPVDVTRLATMVDAGEAAAAWMGAHLGEPVRLVWQDDPARRPVSPAHGGTGAEPLSLADTGPVLLTTMASLRRLDTWIAEEHGPQPMAMARFRPNVVVDGPVEPFAEDGWRELRIGSVPFRLAELCDRCVVTTIDPVTLAHGKEPIRTLARHRRWDGSTWFGVRLVPLATGTITVGDRVEPLD